MCRTGCSVSVLPVQIATFATQFLFQHLLNQYKEDWDKRVAEENIRL